MPETTDLPQITTRRRNWAPWIGLLLALAAMLSNGVYFLGLPGQRAIAWLSIALAIAALVCAAVGIIRAFRQPHIYGGKVSSPILGVLSLLICAFVVFASVSSRALPVASGAPQVGQKVPDFTLADTNGNKVSLDQLLGKAEASALPHSATAGSIASGANPNAAATPTKAVLLVFYRGYW
ncbi:MAG TPA: hypothetical protein VGQ12_18260 [Candidatus Angelobacter sp.]|jgi:hypothetical protein|nr:hypothetical protein [Candidatus Angelobacter sp.]